MLQEQTERLAVCTIAFSLENGGRGLYLNQVGPLLDQIEGPLASFTGDGAYDQDGVYRVIIDHDPDAVVVVPPRATAVLSETA